MKVKRINLVIIYSFILMLIGGLFFSSNNIVYGANIEYTDKEGKIVKLSDFRDTKGHWAHDQILKWADYSIVVGNNGNFMPNNKIIRGDLAIMIDRMLGLKNTTYNYFNDLNTSDYYRESVLKCVSEGYINGVGNNLVNPRGYATREEVASIMCRVFNIDTRYSGSTGFRDDSSISSWAKPSIYALSKLGYMNGSGGYVNPKSHITRAEMITLLSNIADTYISKKDIDGVGTTFVSNFPKNVVTARNIELKNATVGRDLYITQSASTLTLVNSTIRGKVVAMSKASISLNKSNIEQILLISEKSSITGIDSGVEEVYVCEFASESSLDAIPNKLILEPGVRVKVSSVMYENTSSSTKTYYGIDLKADIADEQGYVVGGPKVSGGKATLDYSNVLTLTGVKVTNGNNNIREIGVIWLNAKENEDPKNPTYKNNDGKVKYTGAYNEPFTFNVGKVSGYNTYRVYVRDAEGLYAYSTPVTLKTYSFDTNIKVTDVDYPKKVQVDVVFSGSNVPEIRNVQVIYDVNELYSEKHNTISLQKYTEQNAENPVVESKYKRYTGIINVQPERQGLEDVYNVPTAFGYIITFADGSVINRFPVITNVVPEGVKPVSKLELGAISFEGDNKIKINNSILNTNVITIQEVGVVYKESLSETISNPTDNASGWTKLPSNTDIGKNMKTTFNSTITISNYDMNTFIVPYVRTSNGYYYGSVSKVNNSWKGDVGGPQIEGSGRVFILNSNSAVVMLPVTYSNKIDFNAYGSIVSVKKNGVDDNSFNTSLVANNVGLNTTSRNLFVCFNNLDSNSEYTITFKLQDERNLKSNTVSVSFNTFKTSFVTVGLQNKQVQSDGRIFYTLVFPDGNYELSKDGHYLVNGSLSTTVSEYNGLLSLNNDNAKDTDVVVNCKFYGGRGSDLIVYNFTRTITLN